MRRALVGLLLLWPLAAAADFVASNTPLPANKVNLSPLPVGANPLQYFQASDYNNLATAATDLRNALTSGAYSGFAAQTGDPLPVNATNYFYFKNDNTLHFKYGNTDTMVPLGSSASLGNWVFSGNTADLTAVGTMTIGVANAQGITIKNAAPANGTPLRFDTVNTFTGGNTLLQILTGGTLKAFVDSNGTWIANNGSAGVGAVFATTFSTAQQSFDTAGLAITVQGGNAGAALAAAGKTGGILNIAGGTGSVGTASLAAGAGGSNVFAGGNAGANGGGGGASGGSAFVRGGAASGAGTAGEVTVGDLNTSIVKLGIGGISTLIRGRVEYGLNPQTQTTASLTIDASLATEFDVTLQASVTSVSINGLNANNPRFIIINYIQDATGSRTVTGYPASVKFLPSTYRGTNHTAPTLTTTGNARDTIVFWYDGVNILQVSEDLNN